MASDIGTAYVNIVPKAEGIKGKVSDMVNGAAGPAGTAGGKLLGLKLAAGVAGAAIGAVVVTGIKKSLTEGAALEQSLGGIETLFKKNADTVIENARQAYKTVGVSANEYMENVTSFSAALISSLGGDTAKAASAADTAMRDMSDNANKMGTDIGSIQNAYQGFAKQNYTMLDNLKLGYGGTKEEMQRLLEDASKLSGQEYDISNLNDVYEAIHVVQEELGITGTTAEEASKTMSGSFNSMKAAFTDFWGSLAMGENVEQSMSNLVETIVTYIGGNLIPMIGTIMKSVPAAIGAGIKATSGLLPKNMMGALDKLLSTITAQLPGMLKKGTEFIITFANGLLEKLPDLLDIASEIVTKLAKFIAANYPKIIEAGIKLMGGLVKAIITNAPQILAAALRLVLQIGKLLFTLNKVGLQAGLKLMRAVGAGIGNAMSWLGGKIKGVIDKILSPIKGLVDKIKGFFPINIGKIMSNVKLPHFSVSGGKAPWGIGGAGSMPKFSVNWYAKGGILTEPTLFGGGEKGSEAILPLDPFWKKLDSLKGGNTFNINMTVDGAEDPEDFASRFARRLELEMRA